MNGDHRNAEPDTHRPYWKRAHRSWGFWIGLVLTFAAIIIYIMSDNLSLMPRGRMQQPSSNAVGR